jgi:hypothetical protein
MSQAKRAKVYNDSPWPHTETFKGDKVTVPANGSIEMEFFDAHEFKGQFYPPLVDADGGQQEKSFKRIRVMPIVEGEAALSPEKPRCQACKYEATSKQDLEDHIDANHLDQLEDPEVAQERRKSKKVS